MSRSDLVEVGPPGPVRQLGGRRSDHVAPATSPSGSDSSASPSPSNASGSARFLDGDGVSTRHRHRTMQQVLEPGRCREAVAAQVQERVARQAWRRNHTGILRDAFEHAFDDPGKSSSRSRSGGIVIWMTLRR